MGIKIIALSPAGYLRDKINILDGVIVIMALLELGKYLLYYSYFEHIKPKIF